MADLVSPIVDIISRLWTCCATQTRYLCELQENKDLLRTAMGKLKEARDDVQRRVDEEEADPNEPKMRSEQVRGWLERVETIESEVKVILLKADAEQLSNGGRCLGGCCPPNNCCSNYKVAKSIAKKIPLVDDLKGEGYFQELCVARPTDYVSKLQNSKILLRSGMEELKNVKNDVQRKVDEEEADPNEPKKRTEQVRGWLHSVDIIEGEVKVIMQTSDEQLSNAECRIKDKLVVMKKAFVDGLKAERGQFEELTYRLPPSSVQDRNLEPTVGMESMFDKVWRLITSKDHKVSILGLYGIGGVGKTTLLEKINNEFRKISIGEHGFDHIVMFVVVSKPINYKAIQRKIGERLGLKNSLKEYEDEDSRAEKIFNALRNKNFVILLDDIWKRVDLRRIGIPILPQGHSKLIFTTRSERVCGEMKADKKFKVECLPKDKAWILFQQMVGEDALNSFPDARELAKVVAEECVGLPLALTTIGRAMSTKKTVQEWNDAITTLKNYASEFEGMCDEVLARLKLSYDNLSNETEKSCFRYCALFPKDYSIGIVQLVELWIAEGFLDGFNNFDEARNRGHAIIRSLKSACLLESGSRESRDEDKMRIECSIKIAALRFMEALEGSSSEDDVESSTNRDLIRDLALINSREDLDHVKMHDVIRDLALWIVNGCKTDESGRNSDNKFLVAVNDPCKKWENAERIFWDDFRYESSGSENPQTNLVTLIIVQQQQLHLFGRDVLVPQSFFQHMPLLRVLDLSNLISYAVPISICELHELQYLNLSGSGSTELPVELRKLVKLKFLVLKSFHRIPAGVIANLSALQVLDLAGSNKVNQQPCFKDWELEDGLSFSELDGLKQLQEVHGITITTDVAFDKFLCNRKLQMVCKGLKFCSSSSRRRRIVLDLSNFKSLKDLDISGLSELEELVFLGGGLLSTLERLELRWLPNLNNILWMGWGAQPDDLLRSHSQSLEIIIWYCGALKDLRWLVYVENLKKLYVNLCMGLETIFGGDGFLEGAGAGAGAAEGGGGGGGVFRRLESLELSKLPKLKSICRHALAFPSIQTISIQKCPELKKLPLGSGSNVNNTLKYISGKNKWWNALQWEDEIIKSKFLPYHRELRW